MDMFRFRSKARIVAIVDLILSSMSLCICLMIFLGAVILSSAPQVQPGADLDDDGNAIDKQNTRKYIVSFMWVLAIFTSITTIIQIVAAIKLLNATQLGKDPVGAMKLCNFWRHVCVVFTILLMISILFSRVDNSSSVFTLIQVFLRFMAIYVVTQFMKELDRAITTGMLPIHCQQGTTPIIAGVAYAYIPPNPQQQQQPPPFNADLCGAPPSYQEVMKEAPTMKE